MTDQLQKILANYKILCDHCDNVWERVRAAFPGEIACRKGCGICCELQNVNRLEAYVIRAFLKDCRDGSDNSDNDNNGANKDGAISTRYRNDPQDITTSPSKYSDTCPFLCCSKSVCRVYEARPTICRTHGLILRSSEFSKTYAPSCPYNFPSIHPGDFPPELTIDIDRVTKNLISLNLAFCMVTGVDAKNESQERVPLKDLAATP